MSRNHKPKVFVVQEPRAIKGKTINITPAMDFGEIEYLLPKETNIIDAGFATRELIRKLTLYTPDDFILAIGDPAAIGITCAIASKQAGGRFTVLKWDRQEMRYYPVKVDLNQI